MRSPFFTAGGGLVRGNKLAISRQDEAFDKERAHDTGNGEMAGKHSKAVLLTTCTLALVPEGKEASARCNGFPMQ